MYKNKTTFLFLPIYEGFVQSWEKKISPLTLVDLASMIVQSFPDNDQKNQRAVEFLSGMAEKIKPQDQSRAGISTISPSITELGAYAYALTQCGWYQLELGDLKTANETLIKSKKLLGDGVAGLDYQVHASQYRLTAGIAQHTLDYGNFYHNAIAYLQIVISFCDDDKMIEDDESNTRYHLYRLSEEERITWTRWICMAAILADNVYSFGSLLSNSSWLDILDKTPHSWIKHLVWILHKGDTKEFESFLSLHSNEPTIVKNLDFIRQKQCLMAFLEGILNRGIHERAITFEDIANMTHLPIDEIEFLIMKAMSIELIKGTIDEVDHTVHITWIQSRVLESSQIRRMNDRIVEWQDRVQGLTREMMNSTENWLVPIS